VVRSRGSAAHPDASSAIRTDLAARLAAALATVEADVQARLVRAGYDDIRPGHLRLLLLLDRSGARGADLARRAGIAKQSMGELVAELERLDYVERRPDPRDGRALLVLPTGRGLMLVAHARRAADEAEAELARRVGRERFAELHRTLAELGPATAMDDASPGPGDRTGRGGR